MTVKTNPLIGAIAWTDLTVSDAEDVRDFYTQVVGWQSEGLSMGDYEDYLIKSADGESTVAGICHARGSNAKLPAQWLVYVNVEDVFKSAKTAVQLGGKIIDGPRKMGRQNFCCISDPSGAIIGLLSPLPDA